MSTSPCAWDVPDGERRCLVVVCHNGPVVQTLATRSLMELGWGNRIELAKAAHGFAEISFHWQGGFPRVDAMRDAAAAMALRNGFTHLLSLDADMVFPSNVLERMLRHHAAGIVGGLYCLKAPPYSPVALGAVAAVQDGVTHYTYQVDYGTDVVPVNVLGMGCTLIPVKVFELIGPRPWFTYENDADGWPLVSEDVPFCRKAKDAGIPVLFDPTVKCGHLTTEVIDERYHFRYQQSVQAAAGQITIVEAPPAAGVPA